MKWITNTNLRLSGIINDRRKRNIVKINTRDPFEKFEEVDDFAYIDDEWKHDFMDEDFISQDEMEIT